MPERQIKPREPKNNFYKLFPSIIWANTHKAFRLKSVKKSELLISWGRLFQSVIDVNKNDLLKREGETDRQIDRKRRRRGGKWEGFALHICMRIFECNSISRGNNKYGNNHQRISNYLVIGRWDKNKKERDVCLNLSLLRIILEPRLNLGKLDLLSPALRSRLTSGRANIHARARTHTHIACTYVHTHPPLQLENIMKNANQRSVFTSRDIIAVISRCRFSNRKKRNVKKEKARAPILVARVAIFRVSAFFQTRDSQRSWFPLRARRAIGDTRAARVRAAVARAY